MSEPTPERDYATDPSPRILDAERRREFRALIDASSFGTPGALAARKLGRGETLTADEQAALDAEQAQLLAELAAMRKGREPGKAPRGH
jgi:hypothetical protein